MILPVTLSPRILALADESRERLRAMPRSAALDRMYPRREAVGAPGRLSPLVTHWATLREWERVWWSR